MRSATPAFIIDGLTCSRESPVSYLKLNAGPAFYDYVRLQVQREHDQGNVRVQKYLRPLGHYLHAHGSGKDAGRHIRRGGVDARREDHAVSSRCSQCHRPKSALPDTANTTMCEEVYRDTMTPPGTKITLLRKDRASTTHITMTATYRREGATPRQTRRPTTTQSRSRTATTTTQLFSTVRESTSTLFLIGYACLAYRTHIFIPTLNRTTFTSVLCLLSTAR
jgi:hypothetical protein